MKDQKQNQRVKKHKQKSQTSEYNNESSDSHSSSIKDNAGLNEQLKQESSVSQSKNKFQKGVKSQNQGKQIKGVFEQNDSNEETCNNHNLSGQEKLQGGEGEIGFSDRAYYNVLMKGGRVTRGAIRKEEEPQQSSFGGKTSFLNKTKFAKTDSQDVIKKQKQDEKEQDQIPALQKHQSHQIIKSNNKITTLNKQDNSIITGSDSKLTADKNQQKQGGVSAEEISKTKAVDTLRQAKKNLNIDQKDDKISKERLEADKKVRKIIDKSKSVNESQNQKSELQNKLMNQADQSQQSQVQKNFMKKRNEKALQKLELKQGEENLEPKINTETAKNIKVQNDSEKDIYEQLDIARKQAKLNVQQKLQRQEMLLQKNQKDNTTSTNQDKSQENQNQKITNIQPTSTNNLKLGTSVDSVLQNQITLNQFLQPVEKLNKISLKQTDSKQQNLKNQKSSNTDQQMKAELQKNDKSQKHQDQDIQRQKEELILFGENKEINKNQKVKDSDSNLQMEDQVMHISNIFTEDENYSALPPIQKNQGSKQHQKDSGSKNLIDQDSKNKKSAKKDSYSNNFESIFSQRNQELRERFEYHFPHFQYIENRFVLYGEGIATLDKIDLSKTYNYKNSSQISNIGPNDYEKLFTQVKVYQDSPSIPMPCKHLKYLSRVYICDIKYINIDDLRDEFKENLSLGDESRRKILIVQVVDNSNRYSEDIEKQNADIEDLKLKNHPFQFYCIGKEDFEDRLILTGPVQFINQIQDNEIVQITNLKSKLQTTIQQPEISEINQMEILNKKFDYLKDLHNLDDIINQGSYIKHLAYNSTEISNFIIQQSIEINKVFNKYKEKSSQVLVNEQNMLNSLFTVCQFDNSEKQRCKGVLTQVKYNQQDKNYYLLFRNIQMKSSQNEKLEWIPLMVNEVSEYYKSKHQDDKIQADSQQIIDPNRKFFHVVSEYYRGFVSLDCLKSLDNTYQHGQRLRTKHLYFLSHEISCIQIQRHLNFIFNNSKEQNFGDYASNIYQRNQSPAYLQQQMIADDQSKQSFNFSQKNQLSLKNDSQLQLNKNASGIITKKSSQILTQLKCKKCNIKNEDQMLICSECDDQWHVQCLENKEHLCGMGEKQWRCPKCIRCTNCKSMVNNQTQMLICKCCNTPYHFECLDPLMSSYCPPYLYEQNQKWLKDQSSLYSDQIRQSAQVLFKSNNMITKNQELQPNIILRYSEHLLKTEQHLQFYKVDFKCQYCIECIDCGTKDFGNGQASKWSQDFNFCQSCYNVRKNNQYCLVCMENYNLKKSILDQQKLNNQNENFQIQVIQNNMIQCQFCCRLVHTSCDFILQNQKIKKILIDNQMVSQQQSKNTQKINYCCQECRDKKRNQLLLFILNQIRVEDKNKFFIDKFWEHFYKQQDKDAYLKAVKNPICLEMIQENINEYKYLNKKNDFKQDILQMFQNAKSFNKQNTLVYQDANKFISIFTENYSKWQSIIQKQILAHEVEQKWKKCVHNQQEFQKKYFNLIYTQNIDKENFYSEIQDILEWKQLTLPQLLSDESIKEYFVEQEYFQEDIFNLKQQEFKFTFQNNKSNDKVQNHQSAPLKQTQSQKFQKKDLQDISQNADKASDKTQSLVQRNHKKLRRGDDLSETMIQKDDVVINNSAAVQKSFLTLDKNYEKSAPNEFQIGFDDSNTKNIQNIVQKNDLKRSKQIFEDDQQNIQKQIYADDKSINNQAKNKKQKVKDSQEIISDKINTILQQQSQNEIKTEEINVKKQKAKENDKFSFKDNYSGNDRASQKALKLQNDKTDLNSASGTNASMVHQMQTKNKEKCKNKLIDHYQKVDDEGCYYSNPIRCSFDDPKLIFEEMCYLCGSFGNQEDFVTCVLCGESFHTFCLQLQSEDVLGMYQSNWKCLNCKSCEYCGKATNEDLLMFCGICDRPYHSFCLQPEIKNIPEQWKCDFCFKCKQCGTNKYFNENDIKNGLNLTVNDYQLSKNFSLCYDCGQNEYKKQNCSICLEKTTPDMSHNLQILKCRDCGYYSHIQCSRVTIEELQSLLQEYKEKVEKQQKGKPILNKQRFSIQKIYKCLDCIIKGKSMNFLILESCLHYENIHNLIQRQQFISEICVEILSQYFPEKFRQKAPRFIQKFISYNKDFFRCDEIIVKWLELMETEVSYSKDLYQNTQSTTERDETQINQSKDDDQIMEDSSNIQKKTLFLDKQYWKKYNPFEASKYYYKDQNQEELFKKQKSTYEFERVIYNIDDKVEDKNIPRAVKTEHSMTAFKTSMLPQKRSMYESLYKGNLNRFHQSGKIAPIQNAQVQKPQVITNEKQEEQKLNAEVEHSQPEQCPILQKLTQGTQGESIYMKPIEIQQELYNTNEKREKFVNIMLNGLDADEELSSEYLDSDSSEVDDEIHHSKHESLSLIEMYMHYELKAIMRIKLQFFKWFEEFFSKTINVFLGGGQYNQQVVQKQNQRQQNLLTVEKVQEEDIEMSNQFKDFSTNSDCDSVESMVETLEDQLIQNPQINLTCLLCKKKGEYSITGRLIPYKLNIYVHTNCALWTEGVYDIEDGQIINFYQQQKKLINNKCYICNDFGATLICQKHSKGCNKYFHFPCAYSSGKIKFTKNKELLCENCQKIGGRNSNLILNQTENIQQDVNMVANDDQNNNMKSIMFPSEYIKKRRLYIVQNAYEINQIEYENQLESQNLQDEKKNNVSQSANSVSCKGHSQNEKLSRSERQKKEKQGDSISHNSHATGRGNNKDIEVNKWRPYYYDFFNRVGNLTVLSLRKEVNQIIDVLQQDSSSQGSISNIQSYIQMLQNSAKERNQLMPIQESDSPKKRGKSGNQSFSNCISQQQNTLLDELSKYLDLFNDYATIRIYWKFYDDSLMKVPAQENSDPRKLKRAYFLYLNKNKKIYDIEKNDIKTILEFCSKQIKNNVIIQSNISLARNENNEQQLLQGQPLEKLQYNVKTIDEELFIDQNQFWKRTLDHFKTQKPNFSLQNIEFCIEKLFGLAKYPINVWNQQQFSNNDLKHNLNQCKNRLGFFLVQGISILNQMNLVHFGYPYCLTGNNFNSQAAVNSKDKTNNQADLQQVLTGRVLTLDGVFQRMMKVNNMERYDYDKIISNYSSKNTTQNPLNGKNQNEWLRSSMRSNNNHNFQLFNRMDQISINQVSSKHMSYDQLMVALGKGRKVDISKISKILEEQKIAHGSKGETGKPEDIDSFEKRQLRARKKVLEQKQQLQQINFQNQAQQELAEQSANQIGSQNAIKINKTNLPIAMQYRSAIQMPRKVELGPSKIHRIGLFTNEDLKPLDIVIEYVGEIIKNEVADQREKSYLEKGIGDCYMFRVDDQYIIDATFFGGKARYLNHSCDANCSAKIITVDNQKHIIIRAKKHISAGQELTYNYNFDQEEDKLGCFCGAKNCSGYLA